MGRTRSRAQARLYGPATAVGTEYKVHQIQGGNSKARVDGGAHRGGNKPSPKQIDLIKALRAQTGDTKTFLPDTKLEASDIIDILIRRANRT
jgi:hypothetical protein